MASWGTVITILVGAVYLLYFLLQRLLLGSLAKLPGPKLYALTSWRLAYDDWLGERTRRIYQLHQRYGPAVRIGPSELSFNSLSALRTIYGAGGGFQRTSFYRMFDAYGKQTMFTFGPAHVHAQRKKMLAHFFAKSTVIKGHTATLIQDKVRGYLALLSDERDGISEIFNGLHYLSFDATSDFLYGKYGRTNALGQNDDDKSLIDDMLNHDRRYLSWFVVHFPQFTRWLYSHTGISRRMLQPFLPMQPPTTYSAIRQHALKAWHSFSDQTKASERDRTLVECLWKYHQSQGGSLDDLDIASECADNLLAGIDTTSDTLTFLLWALSLPDNVRFQERLVAEVDSLPDSACDESGVPTVEACSSSSYLDAVIKETLRLYAPLPASEPRSFPTDTIVDGYHIPKRTVVSMSPYALHRNHEVFEDPAKFNPERWLGNTDTIAEMNRWFWAFSSGPRMCIGIHFAQAQMTTLVAAVYRKYHTSIAPDFEGKSPAITSRFELFFDNRFTNIAVSSACIELIAFGRSVTAKLNQEHECWIEFTKRSVKT